MLRRPAFWVVFVAINIAAWWFTVAYFDRAFPVVNLELTMNRAGALEAARELADDHGWGPETFEQAAVFELDETVQVFVELEAGGKEAFRDLLASGLYSPYGWRVRHFSPGRTTETEVRLTPTGEPYGFRVTLPEEEAGPRLDAEDARQLAEDAARQDWRIQLKDFELVESSQELRASERLDHTFVYERVDATLGEGRYRLQLVVSGDRLSGLSHSVELPEAFHQRFAQLRAGNRALSSAARAAMFILFLGCGCLGGLYVLLRRRALIWKQAVAWGVGVGLLQVAAGLSQSTLWWMDYDTALGDSTFVAENLFALFSNFVWLGLGTTCVFMAAEGLTRLAFPAQLQLWRLASPRAAATPAVFGRTAGAYLLLGPYCAYKVAFFLGTSTQLGWWAPASNLSDPNVLATWMPWLHPIAAALRAGFAEECLFRAIPLATAALIGRRFGKPRLWIGAALILQAVVFGAAHANYPNMPAYARLVELILPSILYGLMYLRLGLLPVILLHFAFDVFAYGLPLVASTAPGASLHLMIMVGVALIPLGWVMVARWRSGTWKAVDASLLNSSWTPSPQTVVEGPHDMQPRKLDARHSRWLGLAGVAGLLFWWGTTSFTADAPPLTLDRGQAVAAARGEASRLGWQIDEGQTVLSSIQASVSASHRFVWQQEGPQRYREVLENYLMPPHWQVRFAKFSGDAVERAKEYQVLVGPEARTLQFWRRVPQSQAGAHLDNAAAQSLAIQTLKELGLHPERLEEISVVPTQQPERRDWQLIFRDPSVFPDGVGEARVFVLIAGDEVTSCYRRVQPPESWRRAERDRATLMGILHELSVLMVTLVFVGGLLAAILRWSGKQFAGRASFFSMILMTLLGAAVLANLWPTLQMSLSPSRGVAQQMVGILGGFLPAAVGLVVALALQIGFALRWPPLLTTAPLSRTVLSGLALGSAIAGIVALVVRLRPDHTPSWPDLTAAASASPWLGTVFLSTATFLVATSLGLWVLLGLDHLTAGWTQRRLVAGLIVVVLGLGIRGWGAAPNLSVWLVEGLLLGVATLAVYVFVLRRELSLLPMAAAALASLHLLGNSWLGPFPGSLVASLVASGVILAMAFWWTRRLAVSPSSL